MQPLTRFGSDLPVEPETCPGAAIGDRHISVVGKAERFERITRARLVAIAHGVTTGQIGQMPFAFVRAVVALRAQHMAKRRHVRFHFRKRRRANVGDHAIELRVLTRSEEHTSELQSLMRTSYAVFCLKKKT